MTTSMGAGCAVNLSTGIFLLIVGLIVWKGQKVSLIHASHLEQITDIPRYARYIGRTLFGLGLFWLFIGALCLFETFTEMAISLISVGGSLVFMAIIFRGQKKYSGSFVKGLF